MVRKDKSTSKASKEQTILQNFKNRIIMRIQRLESKQCRSRSGPGCSKPMMSLVNVSLNFQELMSQQCQYFLLKKCEKLSFSHFFQQKILVYLVIKS